MNHAPTENLALNLGYDREENLRQLTQVMNERPEAPYLAQLMASWAAGVGVLPDGMGLRESEFKDFTRFYFGTDAVEYKSVSGRVFDADRMPETEDLRILLNRHRKGEQEAEAWVAEVLISGMLGYDHLWEDMGYWSRKELSATIQEVFPALFEKNDQNMRWKKFIYKQLCIQEEFVYTCRAPSCAECVDYSECFAIEEINQVKD
ncbi:MAG: nitrogen fixation protein NifQ [bacterium]|nr:nitrogen fixation protein NifQ [bacterium]